MSPARVLARACVLLPLAGCAAAPPTEPPAEVAEPFATVASEGLTLEWGGDLRLLDVVDELERVTGTVAIVDERSRELLWRTPVDAVSADGALHVPPERAGLVLEALLYAHGVVLIPVVDEPRVVRLVSLRAWAREHVRSGAPYVPRAELERYRDHPAVVVSTLVELPAWADARTVANTTRTALTDAWTQSVLPVSERVLLVSGPGAWTCSFVELLERVHAAPGR